MRLRALSFSHCPLCGLSFAWSRWTFFLPVLFETGNTCHFVRWGWIGSGPFVFLPVGSDPPTREAAQDVRDPLSIQRLCLLSLSRLLLGLGIGYGVLVSPVYVAEACPPMYRGMYVGMLHVAYLSGMLAGGGGVVGRRASNLFVL